MSFFTAFAIYFVIWWVTLFIVLPYGNRSQAEAGEVTPGTDPGAPVNSRIKFKLLINSIVAAVVLAIYWFVTGQLGITLDNVPDFFPKN